jgi:hypothetical protein
VIPISLSFQKLDLEYNINGSLFFFSGFLWRVYGWGTGHCSSW